MDAGGPPSLVLGACVRISPSRASVAAQPLYGPWSRAPSPPGPRRVPGVFLKSGRGTVLLCRGKGVCAVIVHRSTQLLSHQRYTCQVTRCKRQGSLCHSLGCRQSAAFCFISYVGWSRIPRHVTRCLPNLKRLTRCCASFFMVGGARGDRLSFPSGGISCSCMPLATGP